MTNENSPVTPADTTLGLSEDHFKEDFETAGRHNRMGAMHFSAVAKQHTAVATAADEGDAEGTDQHAFNSFRHQISAVQFAEIADMNSDNLEDEKDKDGI